MRVFLSYASEQRDLAIRLALALRTMRNNVFSIEMRCRRAAHLTFAFAKPFYVAMLSSFSRADSPCKPALIPLASWALQRDGGRIQQARSSLSW
jgi:hypothetical protein